MPRNPRTLPELTRDVERLRRGVKVLAAAILCAIVLVGAIGGLALWNAGRIDDDVQNTLVHNQRCDLENRIGQSEQFLRERGAAEPGLADYVQRVTLPDLRKRLSSLPPDGDCRVPR